jgi:hypothetical protein
MADIASWGWYSTTTWPGYSSANQDNLTSNGNGMSVNPAGYVDITLHDVNNDGVIYDHDTDDVAPAEPTEYVIGPTLTLLPQEIALYTNSTVVIGGVTYTGRNIEVTLFTNGTWGARLLDSSIPAGTHHMNVTSVTLGTWNGVEYDGIQTAAVDRPFVCFCAGAQVMTPNGPRAVELLRPSDLVMTLDAGAQPILWSGRRRVSGLGRAAPIEIGVGVLGNTRAVRVSPQHRLLLGGAEVERRFGTPEVLAAAKHLVDGVSIRRCNIEEVEYVHLLLSAHHLVLVDGLIAETLYPGDIAVASLGRRARMGLFARMPELLRGVSGYGKLARKSLTAREAAPLIGADLRPQAACARMGAAWESTGESTEHSTQENIAENITGRVSAA